MKKFRLSILVISVSAVLGCRDDASSADLPEKGTNYKAEVAFEPFNNVQVWLDVNSNYQQDDGEPSAITDANGIAELDTSKLNGDATQYPLIASVARTMIESNRDVADKSYLMVAPPGIQIITPVSHLVHVRQQAYNVDFPQAVSEVAGLIDGVSEQELHTHLAENSNEKLQVLSTHLADLIPESDASFSQQQIINSYHELETVVGDLNAENFKTDSGTTHELEASTPTPPAEKVETQESGSTDSESEAATTTSDADSTTSNQTQEGEAAASGEVESGSSQSEVTAPAEKVETQESGSTDSESEAATTTSDADSTTSNQTQEGEAAASGEVESDSSQSEVIAPADKVETAESGSTDSETEATITTSDTEPTQTNESEPQKNSEVEAQVITLSESDKLFDAVLSDFFTEEMTAIETSNTIENVASGYIKELQVDGRWLDIDYYMENSRVFPPALHLQRAKTLAVAFYNVENESKDGYKRSAINALEFWFAEKAQISEWGALDNIHLLATIALLLGDDLPEELKVQVIENLPTDSDTQKAGLARVKEATGIIYRGLLVQDADLLRTGMQSIEQAVELTVVDGTQMDWSFVFNEQINGGKFGDEFFYSAVNWAYKAKDSEWKFGGKSLDILASMLLDGKRWMERFGRTDYNMSNISITTPQQNLIKDTATTQSELTSMDMLAELVPEKSEALLAYKSHIYQGSTSGLNGFKHFWRSDYSVTATDDFMFGVKTSSKRTLPTQMSGDESLFGYWLGFGSAFLMQSAEEYHNMFPLMDWTKIPGTTAPQATQAL